MLVQNGVEGVVRRAAKIHRDNVSVLTEVSSLLKTLGMDSLRDMTGACEPLPPSPPLPPPWSAGHGLLVSDTETSRAGPAAVGAAGAVTKNSWRELASK